MIRMIGTAARAVWNGPFYIGKLARPVSLGDVAMKLLETLWRGAILFLATVAVFFGVVVALDARPTPPGLGAQIVGTASLDSRECNATYPLKVELKNNSKERVGRVEFRIAVYEPNRTTDLVDINAQPIISDMIIPPSQTMVGCRTAPLLSEERPLAGLRFVVNVIDAEATQLP